MRTLPRHVLTALPLALALWTAWPAVAHARRGFPLFILISNNPAVMLLGVGLVVVWALFRYFGD